MSDSSRREGTEEWTEISESSRLSAGPVVSVLMVTYNHGPYLAEAIGGVVKQEADFPIELLIGEDYSTDNTLTVAHRFQRQHPHMIRILASRRNGGLHANFRRLAESCRGEYVALCEGDDYWIDSTKLARQVALLKASDNVAIVHTDHVLREDFWGKAFHTMPRGRYSTIPDKLHLSGDLSEQFFSALYTHTSTVMFRGKHLKEYLRTDMAALPGGFIDRCMLNFFATKGRVAYIDEPTSAYRVWPGSITRSNLSTATTLWQWQLEYFETFQRHSKLYVSSAEVIKKRFCIAIARNAFRLGDGKLFDAFRRRLLLMALSWPERVWIGCLAIGIKMPMLGTAIATSARMVAHVKGVARCVKIIAGLIPRQRLFAAKESNS